MEPKKDKRDRTKETPEGAKQRWETPELTKWGSVVDKTEAPLSGAEDFPAAGGTNPV